MIEHVLGGAAGQAFEQFAWMIAHHQHIGTAMGDKLGNAAGDRRGEKMLALHGYAMAFSKAFENLVNGCAHVAVEARHGHSTGTKVGQVGMGAVAHMQQVQFGIALACQVTGGLNDSFVEVVVRVFRVGRVDGCHHHTGQGTMHCRNQMHRAVALA